MHKRIIPSFNITRNPSFYLSTPEIILNPGDFLLITGDNGSGKSTYIRYLAGVSATSPFASHQLAYLGHKNALKGRQKVKAILRDITHSIIDQFQLRSFLDEQVRYLSAGLQRKVALARLIQSQRPIWIMDEPTIHLDDFACQLFWKVIHTHIKEGGIACIAHHGSPLIAPKMALNLKI